MWTAKFWKRTAERVVKSAGQGYLAVWALFDHSFDGMISWDPLKGAAAMAVLSLLTCVVSAPIGDSSDPSLVK